MKAYLILQMPKMTRRGAIYSEIRDVTTSVLALPALPPVQNVLSSSAKHREVSKRHRRDKLRVG